MGSCIRLSVLFDGTIHALTGLESSPPPLPLPLAPLLLPLLLPPSLSYSLLFPLTSPPPSSSPPSLDPPPSCEIYSISLAEQFVLQIHKIFSKRGGPDPLPPPPPPPPPPLDLPLVMKTLCAERVGNTYAFIGLICVCVQENHPLRILTRWLQVHGRGGFIAQGWSVFGGVQWTIHCNQPLVVRWAGYTTLVDVFCT